MILAYSGCPLSEALALTVDRVHFGARTVVFENQNKGLDGLCRAVPVPPALLDALDMVHGIRELQTQRGKASGPKRRPSARKVR